LKEGNTDHFVENYYGRELITKKDAEDKSLPLGRSTIFALDIMVLAIGVRALFWRVQVIKSVLL
jgi:hypothetical protein